MILELRDICKTYLQGKLEVPVLDNVSLSVEEGEYLAIMGPSGSGKTTLMNIIGCLDVPTSGEYLLEGESLSGLSDAMLSQTRLRSIGFVFQSFYLLPRQSALENVALPLLYAGIGKKERTELARRALERVGLGDRVEFKPTQLSGGQCQRVAIARAMVNNPKILLADEPTGALDTASGEQVMELFERLHQEGVTIVMITHEPSIAAHARRVLHIRDGRLVDAPLPAVLPAKPETVFQAAAASPAAPEAVPSTEEITSEFDEPTPEDIAAFVDENYEAPQPEPEPEAKPEPEPEPQPEPEPERLPPVTPAAPAAAPAPGRPSLAAPVQVRRQKPKATIVIDTAPAQPPSPPEEDVLEIESIPVEEPEQPARFAQELAELAAVELPEPSRQPEEIPPEPAPVQVPPAVETEEDLQHQETAAALGAEVHDLLDRGQATSAAFASGDMFLRDATAKEPELIERAPKAGAPSQISFDVWAPPEELDVEAEAARSVIQREEPAQEPEDLPQLSLEADPREKAAGVSSPSAQTPDASGEFGAPKKISLDLTAAFSKQGPPETAPWGPPAKTRIQVPRLVDLPGPGTSAKPSQGGEAP